MFLSRPVAELYDPAKRPLTVLGHGPEQFANQLSGLAASSDEVPVWGSIVLPNPEEAGFLALHAPPAQPHRSIPPAVH